MTTPQYGSLAHPCNQMLIELSEKIRMLAMDTFWSEVENMLR